jgi:hypothetical protein
MKYQGDVRFICKGDSWLMRILGVVLRLFGVRNFLADFWTTIRLPFGDPTIYYPVGVRDPFASEHTTVLKHEMVHVAQQCTALGLYQSALLCVFLPLPVLFSGRWFLEREAWLVSIRGGDWSLEGAVQVLWASYFFPWPRPLMRAWFERRLREP